MKEKGRIVKKIVKQNYASIIRLIAKIVIFLSICMIIWLLYTGYKSDFNDNIVDILEKQNLKLNRLIDSKINHLLSNLEYQEAIITVDSQNIKICNQRNCIYYSIFLLRSLILEELHELLKCKIYINKTLIFDDYYQGVTSYSKSFISKNKITLQVDLAISDKYIQYIQHNIYKKYQRITIILFVISIFLYLLCKVHKYVTKFYYQNKYYRIIQNIKFLQKQKDWAINYSKKADLAINLIFTNAVKSILGRNGQLYYPDIPNISKIPYYIILFQESSHKVCLKKLSDNFQTRFGIHEISNEQIQLEIIYKNQEIIFCSEAFLYQIIYSLVSYIIYLEKQSINSKKRKILLEIEGYHSDRRISITTPSVNFSNNKELFKKASTFFSTHANLFILDIRIVFSILELDNFECTVNYNKILITERKIKSINSKGSNIVKFRNTKGNKI